MIAIAESKKSVYGHRHPAHLSDKIVTLHDS